MMPTFDRSDPFLFFPFLGQFIEVCDVEVVLESRACLIVLSLLKGVALSNFRAARGACARDGISTWQMIVQYFLST